MLGKSRSNFLFSRSLLQSSFLVNTIVLDCNVLSTHVKQTTKGRNFKIDLSLKRPKEKMISKVMMVSSI